MSCGFGNVLIGWRGSGLRGELTAKVGSTEPEEVW